MSRHPGFYLLFFAILLPCGFAAEPPARAANGPKVWVDQIGYRPQGRKILTLASAQPLASLPALAVVDAKSEKTVWDFKDHAGSVKLFNKGQKDGESGDFIAHLDLSEFSTPGRYYIRIGEGENATRSYAFNIATDVYKDSNVALWRCFYYQRADTELPEKYAGVWNHKADHRGPNQASEAHVYKWTGAPHYQAVGKEVADPTPHDVSGGWWDAGNFDKYMGNTTVCYLRMLLAYQLIGDAAKDNEFNIPESGNGVPDLADEIRFGCDWLLRMADQDGAAFGRCFENPTCPPEADTSPVMLTQKTSGATMNRLADLAYTSVVWHERNLDGAFAKKCEAEALKAWKLLEEKPHPWPADPKDPKKEVNTGEWYLVNYDKCKALAAACFFKLTGDKKYDQIVHDTLLKEDPKTHAKALRWTDGEEFEIQPTVWVYSHTPGADPELVKKLKDVIVGAGERIAGASGFNRAYSAGVKGYWWGSNAMVGSTGFTCVQAAELSDDPAAKKKYLDAAEEYIHYLHGRNPLGLCYITNLKKFGAEHSSMVMFHTWLGNPSKQQDPYGSKFIGEGPGKIGPPPGYVVGGANGGIRKYSDNLNGEPWVYNEPCLNYQAPCAALVGYFAYKVH